MFYSKYKKHLNVALNVASMLIHFNENRSADAMVNWVDNQTLQHRNFKNAVNPWCRELF